MLGCIRICGRWVDERVLERLSAASQGPAPAPRRKLIEEFCRSAGWQDAHGQLAISSASVVLRRLEGRGLVQLPARQPRRAPRQSRGLRDDDEPLSPLPQLPPHGGRLVGLRLRRIENEQDPNHRIWNRLIVREHPLGRRPLVGAQLRYLVECEAGIVGAFGFGPPAFHLECRDQWIGWNPQARQQNRGRVIGLSRFLIRRGLRVPNLASQCYGLALRQVADDWQAGYGLKPVLVETYVDRLYHHGRSLAAANWRRLGQSKGRGRDDRKRQHAQSLKDVWVYELCPQARRQLQACPVEPVAPRSVFAPALPEDWTAQEMAGVDLGDERLNARAQSMLAQRWQRPTCSFYRSFDTPTQASLAYKLVENPRCEISLESLLAPHQLQTARRMAAEKVVLLAQDTTGLSYNTLQQTEGLGSIGERGSRGLFLHTLLAFRLDGIPLGTAWAEVWARPAQSDTARRNEQSCDEKESARWVRALQAASQRAQQMPQTMVLVCGDRESDLYELYDQKQAAPANLQVLVRGQHDRRLSDGTQLMASASRLPVGGTLEVKVPRRQGQPARTAKLELRWKPLEIQPPAVALKKSWPALKLQVVLAREVGAPPGVEPIEWLLLTTWPVTTLKRARRLVGWYALRWGIECWHKVLKVVCGVERRQMKQAEHLQRALALDMIIASRVLLLTRLGKEHPELPAEQFYSPEELAVLAVKKKETGRYSESSKLTLLQANILVAMLAGFWGRAGDGHPGSQILAEGLHLLEVLVWYQKQCAQQTRARTNNRHPT